MLAPLASAKTNPARRWCELLTELGAKIVAKEIVNDDLEPLADKLRAYADRPDVNLIVTTGGTGFGPRDNAPEATLRVIEREAPGLAEAMRMETFEEHADGHDLARCLRNSIGRLDRQSSRLTKSRARELRSYPAGSVSCYCVARRQNVSRHVTQLRTHPRQCLNFSLRLPTLFAPLREMYFSFGGISRKGEHST